MTHKRFSAIALDQNHEQLNAHLKGNGGMIGLTEDPDALRKWLLATPELATYVSTFEKAAFEVQDEDHRHHSDIESFIQLFRRDCAALKSAFEQMGNPFLENSEDLYNTASKAIADEGAAAIVQTIEDLGRTQYEAFVKDRLETNKKLITDTIPQNRLSLWRSTTKSSAASKQAAKLRGLKNDCALFSRLFIACQSREGDLGDFFSYENQPCPPSLPVHGQLRSCVKSDIIGCLINLAEKSVLSTGRPIVEAKLFDGAALVHILQPGPATTFDDYASMVFLPFLIKECSPGIRRVDVIWDVYVPNSLKNATREKRGHGERMAVTPGAKLPRKGWGSFLRESPNKKQLFELLARSMESLSVDGVDFYSTYTSSVVSSVNADVSRSKECNHEEADTRLFVHLVDAVQQANRKCVIRTTDSDVLVLAIAAVDKIPELQELWISIGTGGHHRFVAAHLISKSLGPSRSQALPFFHAVTGCDTVSSFATKGKKTAFEMWSACPETTSGFLAAARGDLEEALPIIERYVVALYDRTSDSVEVNECRRKLFTRKGRQIESIPPTKDGLLQHCRRAAYQAGFVWGQCNEPVQSLPDPADWGWKLTGKERALLWEPVWTTQPAVQESLLLLVKCGCKQSCSARCKCRKADLPYTELCECGSTCYSLEDDI